MPCAKMNLSNKAKAVFFSSAQGMASSHKSECFCNPEILRKINTLAGSTPTIWEPFIPYQEWLIYTALMTPFIPHVELICNNPWETPCIETYIEDQVVQIDANRTC